MCLLSTLRRSLDIGRGGVVVEAKLLRVWCEEWQVYSHTLDLLIGGCSPCPVDACVDCSQDTVLEFGLFSDSSPVGRLAQW